MDGAFVRASAAGVSLERLGSVAGSGPRLNPAFDPGLSFALAENLPCVAGRPRDLGAHLERMGEGSRALGWTAPPRAGLARTLAELAARNRFREGGFRLRWWGSLERPLFLAQCVRSSLPAGHPRGIRLLTSAVRHQGPDGLGARLKAGQMLSNRLARAEVEAFAEDGLRLTPDGLVAEGVFSNLAALRRGVLRSPPAALGLLEGVTRARFLEKARRAGRDVREEPLTRYDLWTAEKVWVLSSLRGALPVAEVDGRGLG